MCACFYCKVNRISGFMVNVPSQAVLYSRSELEVSLKTRKKKSGNGGEMWGELTSETSNWQISWKSCKWEWENWMLLEQRQGQRNNGSKACSAKTNVKNKVRNRHKLEAEKLQGHAVFYRIDVKGANLGIKLFFLLQQ